jgi:hypothetical protein
MNALVCFAKELTKAFETIKTDTLPALIDYLQADDAHQKRRICNFDFSH